MNFRRMDKPRDKYRYFLICVFLVFAILVVYWPVTGHDFVAFDDDLYITKNTDIQTGLNWKGVKWVLTTTQAYNWHPLTWLSHMLDYRLFGTNAGAHHLTNLALHAVNTLLVFAVFGRMTGKIWRSAFIAALFALHPLHVESVAWVSERKDVLSTFFWALAVWFYIGYARHRRFSTYVPVVVCFVLGLMAKQMLVTLPFVLLLLDYWPLRRFTAGGEKNPDGKCAFVPASFGNCLLEKLPLLALSVVASIIVFAVQDRAALVKSSNEIPIVCRLENTMLAYAGYIMKTFWPVNLGFFYPHLKDKIDLWQVCVDGLLVLSITFIIVRFRRKYPWLAVGWFWYLGTLVPVIGLVQVGLQSMADRYTYVPLIGIFIIVTWSAAEFLKPTKYRKVLLSIISLAVIAVLSIVAWRQVHYWKDSVTLCNRALAVTTDNDMIHYELGDVLRSEGKIDQAIEQWHEALKIRPDAARANRDLGYALLEKGELDEAMFHFTEALRISPSLADVHNSVGYILVCKNRFEEAIEHFNEALRLRPGFAAAHDNLGFALMKQGKFDQAVLHLSKVIELKPDSASAHYNLARTLQWAGRPSEAVRHLRESLRLKPDWVDPVKYLARILAVSEDPNVRDPNEAIRLAQRGCELTDYKDAELLDVLAAAYAAAGRYNDAAAAGKAAAAARPSRQNEITGKIQEDILWDEPDKPYDSALPK